VIVVFIIALSTGEGGPRLQAHTKSLTHCPLAGGDLYLCAWAGRVQDASRIACQFPIGVHRSHFRELKMAIGVARRGGGLEDVTSGPAEGCGGGEEGACTVQQTYGRTARLFIHNAGIVKCRGCPGQFYG
jgi:hypothetical protein